MMNKKHIPIQLPNLITYNLKIKLLPYIIDENSQSYGYFIPSQNNFADSIEEESLDPNTNYVITIDTEATGPYKHNDMTQFAAVLHDIDNNKLIDYFTSFLPIDPSKTWDPLCFQSFWINNPLLYHNTVYFMRNQYLSREMIFQLFIEWINKHVSTKKNIKFATDNPAFDIEWINNNLPFPFTMSNLLGSYKSILDTKSWICGICRIDPFQEDRNYIKEAYAYLYKMKMINHEERDKIINENKENKICHCALADAIRLAKTVAMFHRIKIISF